MTAKPALATVGALALAVYWASFGFAQDPISRSHGCVSEGETHSSATNVAWDVEGKPDLRPGAWGTADYTIGKFPFNPPHGCRVRITRVYGDFLIWPKGTVDPGKFAGALFSLSKTGPEGSRWMGQNLIQDACMLYVQSGTGGKPERAPIDFDVSAGGLLSEDNVLESKLAVFLNDTGLPIHMEATFTLVYRFESTGRFL